MSPAPTSEEVARAGNTRTGRAPSGTTAPPSARVAAPSTRYTTYNEGDVFRIGVPSNWQELASESTVTFAPQGGHGTINGQSVFTHGVQVGIARNERHNLQEATQELIASLAESNPQLARAGSPGRATLGGRTALRTLLANVSEATGGRERIVLYTTQMADGALFYLVGVAPEQEFGTYQPVINRVAGTIRFAR